jgi:hypothetical protein
MSAELAAVSFRTKSGITEGESWTAVGSAALSSTVPWRTFRWYKGQSHYSGVYWSATMRDHVVCESRLELARLIFADFDRSVHRILAQPFLLAAHTRPTSPSTSASGPSFPTAGRRTMRCLPILPTTECGRR